VLKWEIPGWFSLILHVHGLGTRLPFGVHGSPSVRGDLVWFSICISVKYVMVPGLLVCLLSADPHDSSQCSLSSLPSEALSCQCLFEHSFLFAIQVHGGWRVGHTKSVVG